MAKDQVKETATETKAETKPFEMGPEYAQDRRGKNVKVSPVREGEKDGVSQVNENVSFDEFSISIDRFVTEVDGKNVYGYLTNYNGSAYQDDNENKLMLRVVGVANGSPLKRVTAANPTGFAVEVVKSWETLSNEPEFTEAEQEAIDTACGTAKAAYETMLDAERRGREASFDLGNAIATVKDMFLKVKGDKGKKAWGKYLAEKMGITAEKCKNLASEHELLARFPAEYWDCAPEGANSAKSLNAFHADTRKELCKAIVAGVTFTTKDAKALLAQAKGADVDKVKQVAGDLLDEPKTAEKVAAAFAEIQSAEDKNMAYHVLAPLVTLDQLKERANYLRAAMVDLVNSEVNELTEDEQEVVEAKSAAKSVARGFHNFTQAEAVEHLWNILVARVDKDDMAEILDGLDAKLADYETPSDETDETEADDE